MRKKIHQWFFKRFDRYKLTVINHKKMNNGKCSYKIQKQPGVRAKTNRWIIEFFNFFSKTYVHDVVIFDQILKNHVQHLYHVFKFFDKMNTVLKLSKSYIGYPSVTFVGQRTNNFGLNISADKFKIIKTIKFPTKFKDFETYIGQIIYLRNYTLYYIQLINLLQ